MLDKIVHTSLGVTILGAGRHGKQSLKAALAFAPFVVAADGAARKALARGITPDAIIGDMDGLDAKTQARFAGRLYRLAEQVSTDFEKCIYSIDAPFVIALGVTGSRADHSLAALNVVARYPRRRIFVISGKDVVFLAPRVFKIALPEGTRLSLFPLAPVCGLSKGLRWPIAGVEFSPLGRIGVSNRTVSNPVSLEFDADHMLVILPKRALGAVLRAFDLIP